MSSPYRTQQACRLIRLGIRRVLSEIVSLSQDSTSKPDIDCKQYTDKEAQHGQDEVDRCGVVVEEFVREGDKADLSDVADAGDCDDCAIYTAEGGKAAISVSEVVQQGRFHRRRLTRLWQHNLTLQSSTTAEAGRRA